ncbi:MAG: hypothetical protein JKY65_28750 [Planctomycetes bacterium]|nr:hypothetical protein [Planctomycetota bacterium]
MIPSSPILEIQSEMGLLVLYDPVGIRARVKAASTWYRTDGPLATAERADGRIAVWPMSAGTATSRTYRVRCGQALDSENEEPYLVGRSEAVPLVVISEEREVFLGPVERLPADGAGDRLSAIPEQGQLVALDPGNYSVTACVLDWEREERFFDKDNEPTADAPPDFVLLIQEVTDLPEPPAEVEPLLHLIPRKAPTASTKVRFTARPRSVTIVEAKPKRRRASGSTTRKGPAKKKIAVRTLQPGEMGVGARVRHPTFGIGTVTFLREGFPKAKVVFQGREQKVDKDDLNCIS